MIGKECPRKNPYKRLVFRPMCRSFENPNRRRLAMPIRIRVRIIKQKKRPYISPLIIGISDDVHAANATFRHMDYRINRIRLNSHYLYTTRSRL